MRTWVWIAATVVVTLGMTAPGFLHPLPRLIWNASGSVPMGLYTVYPPGELHIDDLVVVRPPPALAEFLSVRNYLPMGVPMLKHVVALPGQIVCRKTNTITVDGIAMGEALDRDAKGRPLPVWQTCRRIRDGEVFLMNRQSPISMDGRYFGPLSVSSVIGRADPLWTAEH